MSGWDRIITDLAAYLAEIERRLANDDWDAAPDAPGLPGSEPGWSAARNLGTPTREQLASLLALAGRREALLRRLADERHATGRELGELAARRAAGRSYAAH